MCPSEASLKITCILFVETQISNTKTHDRYANGFTWRRRESIIADIVESSSGCVRRDRHYNFGRCRAFLLVLERVKLSSLGKASKIRISSDRVTKIATIIMYCRITMILQSKVHVAVNVRRTSKCVKVQKKPVLEKLVST